MTTPIRAFCLLSLVALLLAVPPAASAAEDTGAPETVRFGVCLSLTGDFAGYGGVDLAGVKLRLDDFNAEAERHGFSLEMVLRDDQSDPAVAAAIVDELADQGIQAIIGPLETGIMQAMAERAEAREVVLVAPTVTGSGIGGGGWAFKMLFTDEQQAEALARFARTHLGVRKAAAIVNTHFEYGRNLFAPFRAAFERLGGRVTAVREYSWNLEEKETPNFINILDEVKATLPDIVMLPGFSEDAIAIIRQSQLVTMKARFFGGDAWFSPDLTLAAGHNLENSFYTSSSDFSSDAPSLRRFLDIYDNSHDPDASLASVDGYDALSVLIEALKRGRTGREIRDGLYALRDFPLAVGSITFDRDKGTLRTVFIHQVVKEGDDFAFVTAARIDPSGEESAAEE